MQHYKKMVDHLETMVLCGNLQSGDRIPPLRRLCEEYNISLGAARIGIRQLQDKGILVARHGSGIYVDSDIPTATDTATAGKRVAVFYTSDHIDMSRSYIAHAMRGVQASAYESKCTLVVHFEYDFSALSKEAEESDAILLMGCYDGRFDKIPVCPCVGLEMHNSYGGTVSTITLDPLQAAQMACDFFSERKLSKVKMFVSAGVTPVHVMRAQAFRERWSEVGELETVAHIGGDLDMTTINDKDCGYFFVSGSSCNQYATAFRKENHRLLADEYCVLSLDGKSRVVPGYESVNTIGIDWEYAGKVALAETIRRIDEPTTPSRRIYLNPFLTLHDNV